MYSSLICHRGRLVVDRATRSPKLNCRNWECGVIVPVIEKAQSNEGDHVEREIGDSDPIDVFKGTVPVPMRVPGRRFMPGVRPWYFLTD